VGRNFLSPVAAAAGQRLRGARQPRRPWPSAVIVAALGAILLACSVQADVLVRHSFDFSNPTNDVANNDSWIVSDNEISANIVGAKITMPWDGYVTRVEVVGFMWKVNGQSAPLMPR
jgi:hypothetical protein